MPPLFRSLTFGAFLVVVGPGVSLSSQVIDASLGTWKLNVAKSKYDPGPPPKTQTLTYEAAGQGVRITSSAVNVRGEPTVIQYTASYDGQDYAVTGGDDFDTTALRRIDAFTVEGIRKRGGKVVQTFTRVVSPDRKTLTITTTGTNAKGQLINNVVVYERQ
jgi:hypothetical protein